MFDDNNNARSVTLSDLYLYEERKELSFSYRLAVSTNRSTTVSLVQFTTVICANPFVIFFSFCTRDRIKISRTAFTIYSPGLRTDPLLNAEKMAAGVMTFDETIYSVSQHTLWSHKCSSMCTYG